MKGGDHLTIKLNKRAFEHAKRLIEKGSYVFDEKEDSKGRYKFPYSDFTKVHRCGVLAAENRAGQYKYNDIETAAAHLHGMIDAARKDV